MSQTVAVLHLIAGAVVEDVHTGDRITSTTAPDGRATLTVYRDGRVAEQITYRTAERIHRRIE